MKEILDKGSKSREAYGCSWAILDCRRYYFGGEVEEEGGGEGFDRGRGMIYLTKKIKLIRSTMCD